MSATQELQAELELERFLLGNPMQGPLPATCPRCGQVSDTIEWRRTNTAYIYESSNWTDVCDLCFEEEQAYWEERWADYRASIW